MPSPESGFSSSNGSAVSLLSAICSPCFPIASPPSIRTRSEFSDSSSDDDFRNLNETYTVGDGKVDVNYSNLLRGTSLEGQDVVIKFPRGSNPREITHEDDILNQFKGVPRIVQALDCGEFVTAGVRWGRGDSYKTGLVLTFAPGGNVYDALSNPKYSIKDRLVWLKSLVQAVKQVHDAGIVHRDIKIENCLLGEDGLILSDFGLAKRLVGDKTYKGWIAGTPGDFPPEVCANYLAAQEEIYPDSFTKYSNEAFGTSVDMWNIGLVIYDMFFKGPLFFDAKDSKSPLVEQFRDRLEGTDGRLTEWISNVLPKTAVKDALSLQQIAGLKEIMLACFSSDPTKRPSAAELIAKMEIVDPAIPGVIPV